MRETTIALALLKANWDEHHKSYLDNFNILTTECLRHSTEEFASSKQLVDDLKARFGLTVPHHVAEILLKRASKTGLLRKEYGAYHINRDAVDRSDFDQRRRRVADAHEALVQELSGYARETFDVDWSEEQTERTLHDYLNEHALDLVRAMTRRLPIALPKRASRSEKYLLATFVNKVVKENEHSFTHLQMVVEGTILVSALFFPNPHAIGGRFGKTTVFLDTSFLLQALGHCGSSLREPARELLDLLYGAGADLACFEHTYDEVGSVLNACATNLSTRSLWTGYGPAFDHFLQKGFSESDVRLLVATLDRDLAALNIAIRVKPRYDERFTIDEAELQTRIEAELHYANPQALHRDVDSISAVIRLRRGATPRELERSRAIFVTSNEPLTRAANGFFRDEAGETFDLAPVCISAWHLTSLLWLKQPLARPDLPQKRIIADFHAAVQPDERFMKRYLREVDKLEASGAHSPEDVFLLRNSLEARWVAMNLTVGDDDAFTQGTVPEVLEIVRESIRAEDQARLAEQERKAEELSIQLRSSREELEDARKEAQRVREAHRLARERLAHRVARVASFAFLVISAGGLVLAAYFATPLAPLPEPFRSWSGLFGAAVVLVMSLANWIWGATLSGVRRRVQRGIRGAMVSVLNRQLGESEEPDS
jgi:tRNA U34 5-methylaminomethyl-2-thiouridine-forming methyltransferase MnmC